MIKHCLLDMDGILADFVGAAHRIHNRPYCYDSASAKGIFDIEKLWGVSKREFWKHDSREFWETVEPTAEADTIVSIVTAAFGVDNVYVVTAPSLNDGCIPGKRTWMAEHFPQLVGRMVFTGHKHILATPSNFLVDDKDSNIAAFKAAGGRAFLFPRDWNKNHTIKSEGLRLLRDYTNPWISYTAVEALEEAYKELSCASQT